MPMPHRTQMQLIKRRLVGKEGTQRVRELRAILDELPNYRNGPYADIRKWVKAEIDASHSRVRVVGRDSIEVPRQGAARIALVGAPNVGKSTLLQALSDIQIRTGDFAFTTTRPVGAVTRIRGVPVQLVEIPGLIRGAAQGRGGARALLGVLRGCDAMVLCHAAGRPTDELLAVTSELDQAGIYLPAVVAVTRSDEDAGTDLSEMEHVTGREVLAVSILDEASLDQFRASVWRLTGLIRIALRAQGAEADAVMAFRPPITVATVADAIHHDLGRTCVGGRVWGPSARFPGQRVGRDHQLGDGDELEVLA